MNPPPGGFQQGSVQREDFVAAPIPREAILEGEPAARTCNLSESEDKGISMNLWDCTAGRFRWTYYGDELLQVLEGEVRITDENGNVTLLREGDTAHFDAGESTIWDVPVYVRKLAFHRTPQTLWARALRKLRVMARRSRRRRARAAAPVLHQLI
jgi:uncharacterized cupin superfamily protein